MRSTENQIINYANEKTELEENPQRQALHGLRKRPRNEKVPDQKRSEAGKHLTMY